MYEIGKKRPDGKYNIWKKTQIGPHHWDWIIEFICDSYAEAIEWMKDKPRRPLYKVNQGK